MKHIFMALLCLILYSTQATAQKNRVYRKYATQKVQKEQQSKDKELLKTKVNLEGKIAKAGKRASGTTIPIVFHIIYSDQFNQVSEEQVLSQIQALNRDFSKTEFRIQHPADTLEGFAALAADTEISFCLAGETPNNKKTSGINYHHFPSQTWAANDAIKAKKGGVEPWKTDEYLNVWVAPLAESVSGYAQMPGGSAKTDGIVIDYRFFGVGGTSIYPYDQGKTLTHLVGSYLGLYELWSEDNYCGDDYVTDTPIHNSPNLGCPEYKHISLCGRSQAEMTMNFMDNTDDACQYMFTKGQKIRMQTTLGKGGSREKLAQGNVACATIDNRPDQLVQIFETNQDNDLLGEFSMEAYPNPSKGKIYLNIYTNQAHTGTIEGFSVLGDQLFLQPQEWTKGENTFVVDSDSWDSGTYYFRAKMKDKTVVVKAVISK